MGGKYHPRLKIVPFEREYELPLPQDLRIRVSDLGIYVN